MVGEMSSIRARTRRIDLQICSQVRDDPALRVEPQEAVIRDCTSLISVTCWMTKDQEKAYSDV